jgi:hypothetical protein
MNGIHVNWTKPYFERHRLRGHGFESTRQLKSEYYDQPDYQILYTILSAHYWKAYNGPIKLYTDSIGLAFYQQFKITEIYDDINISFLNGYSKTDIDPAYFWTSGKIKVLSNQYKPFVFLDQDMIIRTKLPEGLLDKDITITHWEIPSEYYRFKETDWEKDIKHIDFPIGMSTGDWTPNTSFLCFNNLDLVKQYTDYHAKLVNNKGEEVPEWFWLFTDQGILGHLIRQGEYTLQTLTDMIFFGDSNHSKGEQRHKGFSEPWYYPIGAETDKDTFLKWEHVWLNKVGYGFNEKLRKLDTQRFFDECVDLGLTKYLEYGRFQNYWDEYHKNH